MGMWIERKISDYKMRFTAGFNIENFNNIDFFEKNTMATFTLLIVLNLLPVAALPIDDCANFRGNFQSKAECLRL